MKWWVIFGLLLVALVTAEDSESEESGESEETRWPLAENCDAEACKLPDCRCSSINIPGGLEPRHTPQFVTLTFDDGVNVNNILTYRRVLTGRTNSNNCPARATFFINHEYTNYQLVNELYNGGNEIALHSITHQTPQSYWANATYEDMVKEFADQKHQMSHFANIPANQIKGLRMPFLQLAGNSSFQVMKDHGLLYDLSWPTIQFRNPALWPYTLDYASTQDCIIGPCPSASIPGVWVQPMISWTDLNQTPCSMVDACVFIPDRTNEEEWFKFILTNFERHYMSNRAPFGFYVHEGFLNAYPAVLNALIRFLDLVNRLEDAFMVRADEVINWVRNPVPIDEYKKWPCPYFPPAQCTPRSCGPIRAEHSGFDYWMQLCQACPRVYPWIGNPLGA